MRRFYEKAASLNQGSGLLEPEGIRSGWKVRYASCQTSRAISTTRRTLAHCSSSVMMLPSSVEEKPHCGERQSCTSGTYFAASAMRLLVLEFGELGGDEAEDDRLVLDEAQRLESARALAVVLEEEAVDGAVREEDLGDGFVAAGGEPRGAEVAAADVHRERQVGGLGGDDPVEDADVAAGHGVDVDAAGGVGGALFSGAEFAPARVVELPRS